MSKQLSFGFPLDEVHQTIPARFEKIASKMPGRLALSHNDAGLTYEQLNHSANQLAHALIDHLGKQSELVLLLVEEAVNQAIAQLGCLKAGMVCVPMDVRFPAKRQAQILQNSGARMIVTERKHRAHAEWLLQGRDRVLLMEQLSDFPSDNPDIRGESSSLAYVLFTSGSTGSPKGIMQTHENLLHVAMLYHRDLGIGCEDRITTPTSPAYTGTIWALLGALTNGASFLFTRFDSPQSFLRFLNRESVTVAQMIVTLLRQFLFAFGDPLKVPSLRLVYTGGETLHAEDVRRFAKVFSMNCGLLYNFGSTEAGMISHFPIDWHSRKSDVKSDEVMLPVGFSVDDTDVVVVDENGRTVECQEEGEITVSSRYLSPGYWRDEELTRMRFKKGGKYDRIYFTGDFGAFDSAGRLIYLGRKDNQVKVRGYRVNLEEIEAALRSIEGISECAVVFREDPQGKARIVAYLERNGSSDLKVSDLRKRLESLLPVYMIPSLLFYMDHLPIAPNGKLDRSMLSSLNFLRPELNTAFQLPETETERFLCCLLSETLGVDPVGSQDNLFEMGVDSIITFQLIGRIQNVLHIDITPALVFASPVIADLARKIDECLQVSRTNHQ